MTAASSQLNISVILSIILLQLVEANWTMLLSYTLALGKSEPISSVTKEPDELLGTLDVAHAKPDNAKQMELKADENMCK